MDQQLACRLIELSTAKINGMAVGLPGLLQGILLVCGF